MRGQRATDLTPCPWVEPLSVSGCVCFSLLISLFIGLSVRTPNSRYTMHRFMIFCVYDRCILVAMFQLSFEFMSNKFFFLFIYLFIFLPVCPSVCLYLALSVI